MSCWTSCASSRATARRSSSFPTSSARSRPSRTPSRSSAAARWSARPIPAPRPPSWPSMMVGRAVSLTLDKAPANPQETTFQVKDLTVIAPSGQHVVDGISFDIARGEILAVAGVQGNGQTELTEAILGLQDRGPRLDHARRRGTRRAAASRRSSTPASASCPEDRSLDGADRHVLHRREPDPGPLRPGAVRQGHQHEPGQGPGERQDPDRRVRRPHPVRIARGRHAVRRQPAEGRAWPGSSPGRCGSSSPPSPPAAWTSGSIEFLHKRIVAERDHGTPVMIVSTELDEVIELADRIAVLYKGRLVGIVPAGTGRDVLGLMMAGRVPAGRPRRRRGQAPGPALENPPHAEPAGNPAEPQATNPAPAAHVRAGAQLRRRRRRP